MTNRFDEVAVTWDEKPYRQEMAVKFTENILKSIQNKNYTSALEYGCGTGNVSFILRENFSRITLADSSEGMIEQLKMKIDKSGVKNFYPRILDFEKESASEKFDIIYTLMTLHHVKDVAEVIKQFSLALNPGGLLIIGDLEKEDGYFHKYPENQDVHHGFEKQYIEELFKKNQLITIQYKVFYEMERDNSGIAKTYPLFAISATK